MVHTRYYFSLFFKLTFLWLDLWPLTGFGSASLATGDCLGLNGPLWSAEYSYVPRCFMFPQKNNIFPCIFPAFVLQQTALILQFSWVKNIMCLASWRHSVLLILLFLIFSLAISPLCLPLGHEFHFHWYSLGRPRFSCNNTESLQRPENRTVCIINLNSPLIYMMDPPDY